MIDYPVVIIIVEIDLGLNKVPERIYLLGAYDTIVRNLKLEDEIISTEIRI